MNCLDTRLQKQLRFRVANILLCSLAALSLSFAARAGQADSSGSTDIALAAADASTYAASGQPGYQTTLSLAQQTEMKARIDLSNKIIENVSDDAQSRGANDSWRMALLSDLYKLPSENLRAITEHATNLADARLLTSNAARQTTTANNVNPKLLGSSTDSLVFTPTTPCRFIDTRNGGSPITSTPTTYNMINGGTTYGGAGGCVFPGTVPALAANVTVVVASGPAGYLALRPTGSNQLTSFINWPTGGTPGLANAGIIALAPVSSGGTAFDALAASNTPQLIVDIFGYFESAGSPAEPLDCINETSSGTNGTTLSAHQYLNLETSCPSGYNAISASCYNGNNRGGIPTGDIQLIGSSVATTSGGSEIGSCQWLNTTANTTDVVYGGVRCCRSAAH